MNFLSLLTDGELRQYSNLVRDSIVIRRHVDLLRWLQGDLQRFIPHEIMIAAWGDFGMGLIHYDIISLLPGVRTEHANGDTLAPLLHGLFDRWVELGKVPYALGTDESGLLLNDSILGCALGDALHEMRSSLVHGISDERGRHDCLYVAFSLKTNLDTLGRSAMEFLLPYLDTALRQVPHLARQHRSASPPAAPHEPIKGSEGYGLTDREIEIMHWVSVGKTNSEIGTILDISAFTVKNHLQRIFKKLDVYNRMQAVSKFEKSTANA
jgi:transcriptional regulator EpsA